MNETASASRPGSATTDSHAIVIENLSKSFDGVRVLDGVSLQVRAGEVHGLIGQNGSGKSTLIKILSGFHEPDPGAKIEITGQSVALPLPPGAFRNLGLAFVHQHLGLVPTLSVLENLEIVRFATEANWFIDWRGARSRARALFASYSLRLDPDTVVADLSPVERAQLAIIRAVNEIELAAGGGVLVLDEPTPFLPAREVAALFELIRRIVSRGAAVIFVSHDVDEVMQIADRATVLRDGRVVGTVVTSKVTPDDLVRLIVGQSVGRFVIERAGASASRPECVRVKGLATKALGPIDFVLHRGEIVGVTGLVGSGYEDISYALFGASPGTTGRLVINHDMFDLATFGPKQAIQAGVVLVPADRLSAGVVGELSVADNISLPVLETRFPAWCLSARAIATEAERLAREYQVRPPDPDRPLATLSGGNQQKVVLAKWLQTQPRLVLLDEPTQGVDVGARQQLLRIIADVAARGAAILCTSSDYEQLAQLCDRVLVMSAGTIAFELSGAAITKEVIAENCYRAAAEVRSGRGRAYERRV